MELWLSAAELPQELSFTAAELSQKLHEALKSIPKNLKRDSQVGKKQEYSATIIISEKRGKI